MRTHLLIHLVAMGVLLGTSTVTAGEHPGLLIRPPDVQRLRVVCGTQAPADGVRAGAYAGDFQLMRARLSQGFGDVVLPGEVAASAFLHLVAPNDPGDRARLDMIASALSRSSAVGPDLLEIALALDWCWHDLSYTARQEFLISMQDWARLLESGDSPLDPAAFRDKLATLAIAVVVDGSDFDSPSWRELRGQIIAAARAYAAETLPHYISWHGGIPTSPATAAQETGDTVALLEVLSRLTGEDLWSIYGPRVGRWLEHDLLSTMPDPELSLPFVRDDGDGGPPTPVAAYAGWQPLTAHLLAARTHSPSAAAVADLVAHQLDNLDRSHALLWRWVPIVFDLHDVPRCDITRLPAARNLDGAVVLRSGGGPTAAAIWIDTGQPFMRRGQHFDVGNFLIRAGGHLTVDAGADISLEAIAAKGGKQRLEHETLPFNFEQFSAATVAHNCLMLADPARVWRWYGRPFYASGGQVPHEGTCRDFRTPLEKQGRRCGKLVGYGSTADAAYVAVDLSPAYDARSARRVMREFLFLWGRALLVVDRVEPVGGRVTPISLVQIPAAPTVAGAPLTASQQIDGLAADRGVWRIETDRWLRWQDRSGSLAMRSLLPPERELRAVGGPAERVAIPHGRNQGRTYVGGGPDTFERLIVPSSQAGAGNAWFVLDTPTHLGPQFGRLPLWGRIEVQAPPGRQATPLVTLFMLNTDAPPAPEVAIAQDDIAISLEVGTRQAVVHLKPGLAPGGSIEWVSPDRTPWSLPDRVQPDPPWPTVGG